ALADDVQVTASTQRIQQISNGRLVQGHRGELLGVNLGRITLSFTRWPSPCYSASQGPALKVHHFPGRLPRELRQAGARQLWILIPLAVVIAALAQAWSRRRQRHGHRDDSPAEQVVDK